MSETRRCARPHRPTLIARDRGAGARIAEGMSAARVLVMDYGLQECILWPRTLAIVMVDGVRGLGNRLVMPAGPRAGASRVPARFWPWGGQSSSMGRQPAMAWPNGCGISSTDSAGALPVPAGDVSWLQGQRIVAWAGIASPRRFFMMLEAQAPNLPVRTFAITSASRKRMRPVSLRLPNGSGTPLSTENDLARLRVRPESWQTLLQPRASCRSN